MKAIAKENRNTENVDSSVFVVFFQDLEYQCLLYIQEFGEKMTCHIPEGYPGD